MSKVFESLRRLEAESDGHSADLVAEAKAIFKEPAPSAKAENGILPNGHAGLNEAVHSDATRILPLRLSVESPLIPFTPETGNDVKAGEQYRIIRTKIVQHPRSPRMMAISSVDPGDGKTVTSVNVAAVLALKNETNVLLVDCDLRRGRIAGLLGFPDTPGLTDVLTGACSLGEAMIQTEQFPNLRVLAAGTRLTNPTELLDSAQWRALAQQLRRQFDYVILDTPPIGALADCDLIQTVSDGIMLVARPDYTNRSRCLRAISSIPPERLIGVILNCVEDWFLARSSAHYGYYEYAQAAKKNR